MSASGTANLRVTGTASAPVILGRINLTSGDLIFQGNRYVLQSAVIDFVNPSRTEPNVNASVTTTIQQYNVGIRVEGPVDHLRASYSSDPALPPADIISLLAFGKTQEASNAAGSTTNQQTAEQSIASAVSGQVTNRLQKIAGISYISVDPTLGIGQQNARRNHHRTAARHQQNLRNLLHRRHQHPAASDPASISGHAHGFPKWHSRPEWWLRIRYAHHP